MLSSAIQISIFLNLFIILFTSDLWFSYMSFYLEFKQQESHATFLYCKIEFMILLQCFIQNKKLRTWTNCIMYLTAFPLICLCYSTCFFKDNSKEMNKFRKVYFSSCICICEVGTHGCHVFFIKSTANVVLCK